MPETTRYSLRKRTASEASETVSPAKKTNSRKSSAPATSPPKSHGHVASASSETTAPSLPESVQEILKKHHVLPPHVHDVKTRVTEQGLAKALKKLKKRPTPKPRTVIRPVDLKHGKEKLHHIKKSNISGTTARVTPPSPVRPYFDIPASPRIIQAKSLVTPPAISEAKHHLQIRGPPKEPLPAIRPVDLFHAKEHLQKVEEPKVQFHFTPVSPKK